MITKLILGPLAFLSDLKPWHFIVAGLLAWTGIVGTKAYRAGGNAVIEHSKIEGKKNEAQASRAHERARAPGAADRLRKTDCRDC